MNLAYLNADIMKRFEEKFPEAERWLWHEQLLAEQDHLQALGRLRHTWQHQRLAELNTILGLLAHERET